MVEPVPKPKGPATPLSIASLHRSRKTSKLVCSFSSDVLLGCMDDFVETVCFRIFGLFNLGPALVLMLIIVLLLYNLLYSSLNGDVVEIVCSKKTCSRFIAAMWSSLTAPINVPCGWREMKVD